MTRINCVPPSELHKKHLVAEYHEITRVFGLCRSALAKGVDPATLEAPEAYTLGTGHVRFFYTRLGYCKERMSDLAVEMIRRGMKPQLALLSGVATGLPKHLFRKWKPTEADKALNRARLQESLKAMEDKAKNKMNKKDESE